MLRQSADGTRTEAVEGLLHKKNSLYNGYDKLGYEYQTYTMVKVNPRDEDWPSDDIKPIRRRKRKRVSCKC